MVENSIAQGYNDDGAADCKMVSKWHGIKKIYVDSSAAGAMKELKIMYSDTFINYEKVADKKITDRWIHSPTVFVTPINFSTLNRIMLRQSARILEKQMLRCSPGFTKFISYLRTAVTKTGNDDLDKENTTYDNVGDCYRMLSLILRDSSSE